MKYQLNNLQNHKVIVMKNNLKTWRKSILLLLGVLVFSLVSAQTGDKVTIKGTVVDDIGEPVIGASIVEKGTVNGVSTDLDGSFTISVQPNSTLVVSFIGFHTQELPVKGNTNLSIILKENAEVLDEVIVIGYGTMKKEDLTGSISTVSTEKLSKTMATSASDMLVGQVAGVNIISKSGEPGSPSAIRIRGGSSAKASNDPLVVIDGVPVDSKGVEGMANPLTSINSNDIESFTVLKDASATAIYGSRASNGVIIITTKKGQSGKVKVNYNGTFSISTKKNTIDVLNSGDFRNLVTDRFGAGSSQTATLGDASTDWQDQIYRTAFSTDHNIGVSGAIPTANLPYRVSIGYTNENGILKTSNLERWTGAVNLSPKFFNNMLSVQLNVKGVYNKNRFADKAAVGAAAEFDPTQPVHVNNNPYGNGYYMSLKKDGTPIDIGLANPLAILEQKRDVSKVYRSIGNLQLDYKMHFLPELRANLNLGYDVSKSEQDNVVFDNSPMSYVWGINKNGWGENNSFYQLKRNTLMDFYLNYNNDFNKHHIDVMGGYSWQNFYRNKRDWYPYSADAQAATGKEYYKDAYAYASESYLISFFGRANYAFDNRYLMTFTLRNDGSSKFARGNRWGLFPSLALAWRISEESFLKNQDVLSNLKLRLGYGITGQQNIMDKDYPYMANYFVSKGGANYFFGDEEIALLRPGKYDKSLKWERTATYNVGFDYGFLKNRISGAIDFYYRKTTDLLNEVTIPAGANFSNRLLTNVGELENKGIEVTISGIPIQTKDLTWTVNYNIAYNKNEMKKLSINDDPNYAGIEHGSIDGGTGTQILIHQVGKPYNSFFVYQQIYDSNGKPIEGAYVDQNHDGKIDAADRIAFKKAMPDVTMGISSSVSYKNWDFSFSGHASINNYVYNNTQSNHEALGKSYIYDPSGFFKNRVSSAIGTNFEMPQYLSSYYVQKASFFKLDNISVGYTFDKPTKWIESLRVYGSVNNVFTITPYDGLDPEVGEEGIDKNIFPYARTFSLGLGVNF